MRRVGIGATPTCVSLGLAPVVSPFASPTVVEASAVCCLFFLPLLHRVAPFSTIYHPRLSFLSLPSPFHRSYLSFRLLVFPSFSSFFLSTSPAPFFSVTAISSTLSFALSTPFHHHGFKLESAQFPRQHRRICKTATRDDLTAFRLRPQS